MNYLENFKVWNAISILPDNELTKIKGGGDPPPYEDDNENDG